MQSSRLIHFLRKLSEEELKAFHVFLQSPYHNTNMKALALFNVLMPFHPEYRHKQLTKEKVFQKLFPKKNFNSVRIRNIMSECSRLLEDFLAVHAFKQQELANLRLQAEYHSERRDDKHFERVQRKQFQILEDIQQKKPQDYLEHYLAEAELYHFTMKYHNRQKDNNIGDLLHSLDAYYLVQRLRYTCSELNTKQIVSGDVELGISLADLLPLVENEQMQQHPLIAVYTHLLKLLAGLGEESEYEALQQTLVARKEAIHQDEIRQIYSFMLNHQIRRMRVDEESRPKVLDLYMMMLEEGYLFVNEQLVPIHFNNIVTIGLSLKRFEQMQKFIESYISKIEAAVRDDIYNYNLSKLYFAEGSYRKAIRLINSIQFLDFSYYSQAKIILLKSYYERNTIESVEASEYAVEAFARYLQRNKTLSTRNRRPIEAFVSYYRKLMKLKYAHMLNAPDLTKINVEKLIQKIRSSHSVEKIWLLEKLAEVQSLED